MDTPIHDPRQGPKDWENAQRWATAALAAARDVQAEAERAELNLGKVITHFTPQFPFNPWMTNRTWLYYKYDLSLLSLDGELPDSGKRNLAKLREGMRKIWNESTIETPILTTQNVPSNDADGETANSCATKEIMSDNASNSDPPLVLTTSVATSTDDIPMKRVDAERMLHTISALTKMINEVMDMSSTVKTVAMEASNAVVKLEEAAEAFRNTAGSIDSSLSTVRRQLVGRDLSLEARYNDYISQRMAEGEGLDMVQFYLLAQDKVREYNFLLIDENDEARLQNVILFKETDYRQDLLVDKQSTRKFLCERVRALTNINHKSTRVRELYKKFLALNSSNFYRIVGVDLGIISEFMGSVRDLPIAHHLEITYYQLVLKRSIDSPTDQ